MSPANKFCFDTVELDIACLFRPFCAHETAVSLLFSTKRGIPFIHFAIYNLDRFNRKFVHQTESSIFIFVIFLKRVDNHIFPMRDVIAPCNQ